MPKFKYIFFFIIEFLLSKITNHIFFVSKEDFLLAQKFNFKKKKYLHYISNGVDNNFKPKNSKKQKILTRNKFKIPLKNITFGIAARFVKEKGFLELIQAFSFVSAKYKNISLCICGTRLKGEHNADVSDFINNAVKSFPDNIFLIGELPSSRMPDFYNALDVFVLPSWREGMPMTIIEAMMCGLPVIASNIRGCREAVKNKKNGLLFSHKNTSDLKKALEFLIKNPLLIDRYSIDSFKVASQKFKLEKIISYQLAIYNQISLERK